MGNSREKPDRWWSKRHETKEAQDAARERYQRDHGPAARKRKAQERLKHKETE